MEKTLVIDRVKELAHKVLPQHEVTRNQSQIAVLMTTFGVTWDEVKNPTRFSPSYQTFKTDDDLRREFDQTLMMLKRAKAKGLHSDEHIALEMLKGFILGVAFFNTRLSQELSHKVTEVYK